MTLRVRDVTLELGSGTSVVKALDDISVQVAAGELVVVLGPSGAGKSSLLAVSGGLRTPTRGNVWIGDTEITQLAPGEAARVRRQHIGFVFQQSNLLPALTALEQLLLMVHMDGGRVDEAARDRAQRLLDEVGMASKSHRRTGQLSGGERQRVGIARSFMNEPRLLLVDEPTSMLDRQRGHQTVELLRASCHEHGVATLMVTHDQSVLDLADRVVEISDGRLSEMSVANQTSAGEKYA